MIYLYHTYFKVIIYNYIIYIFIFYNINFLFIKKISCKPGNPIV